MEKRTFGNTDMELSVVAKRPIANVAWRTRERPESPYVHVYWERLRKLGYEFLGVSLPEAVSTALRFTLGAPGVHTAIVGTARPGRWSENSASLEEGPLSAELSESIRSRWHETARDTWIGQG